MLHAKITYVTRSPADRRTPVDRRVIDIGPGYPGKDKRAGYNDRRRGWEDRFGWERTSRWSSSLIYSDLS